MTQKMKALAARAGMVLLLATVACSSTDGSDTADTSGWRNVSAAPGTDVVVTNATNFHLLDFVAWNNHDVDMFRRLHTADVKVEFGGVTTNGLDAHVQALRYLLHGGASLKLNLGTGTGHTVREVIRAVEQATGRPVPVVEAPRRAGDPPALVADASQARMKLDWAPSRSDLATIVGSALRWHQRPEDRPLAAAAV